jgi:putative nucleotidyltransferase with HDIG domain
MHVRDDDTTRVPMTAAEDDPRVEALLREAPVRRAQPLAGRARLIEGGFAVSLLGAILAMALVFPHRATSPAVVALLLVVALASLQVRFTIGAYIAAPVHLATVPILLLLPGALAVSVIALACVLSSLPACIRGQRHPDRIMPLIGDQWYAAAAATVLALAAPATPDLAAWPAYLGALAALLGVDGVIALARLRLAHGVAMQPQLRTSILVFAVDAALAPLGLLAGLAAAETPLAIVLVLPLLGLLELLGRERERRIQHALALSEAYRGSALLMGEMLEADDEYTGGEHTRGVVALALAVGVELGLDPRDQRQLEFGALLHDIGKLRTPDEIINKPGKLTPAEWAIIRQHPADGQAMLDRIGGVLTEVGLVVRHHHERWDGAGYPDGIRGEAIPIAARIICACDAYSAMTTDRSYRAAMPSDEAIAELWTCAGTQFDPRVVEAVVAVLRREIPAQPSIALAA